MKKIVVLAAAVVFVLGMSVPSWAVAEFNIGASIRTNIQYNSIDDERAEVLTGIVGADGYGDTSISMGNGGRSRLYLDTALDDFSARIEIRLWDGRQIRVDRVSATWAFQEGMYFLFGFDSDLVDLHWSDAIMDNNANWGFGAIGDNKQAQLQLGGSTEAFTWGVDIASAYTLDVAGTAQSIHAVMPRIEGLVKFPIGEMFDIGFTGWYQTFELMNDPTFGGGDESVDEWGINSRFRYNSEFVNVGLGFFYGENLAVSGVSGHPGGAPVADGTSLEDVTTYGGLLTLSFPLETVALGVGGGLEVADRSVTGDVNDDWTQYNFYVNIVYNFTDNFKIIPEVLYRDYGDSFADVEQGSEVAVGARLQADF